MPRAAPPSYRGCMGRIDDHTPAEDAEPSDASGDSADEDKQSQSIGVGIALGVSLGVTLSLVLDSWAYLGIGIALGVVFGIMFGEKTTTSPADATGDGQDGGTTPPDTAPKP